MYEELTDKDLFQHIAEKVHKYCGIDLHSDKKRELIKGRLGRRVRELEFKNLREYFRYVDSDVSGKELAHMVDLLTTNHTHFFREKTHLDLLGSAFESRLQKTTGMLKYRIWSAVCSSGEEPYSIAMTLAEICPDLAKHDVKILATDISRTAVGKARAAIYDADLSQTIDLKILSKYFTKGGGQRERDVGLYSVIQDIRSLVSFAQLNLLDPWPMKGKFDAIFCRNVMIYFDTPTKERLVDRLTDYLSPDGSLYVGHSEGLVGICHQLKSVAPAVYKLKEDRK